MIFKKIGQGFVLFILVISILTPFLHHEFKEGTKIRSTMTTDSLHNRADISPTTVNMICNDTYFFYCINVTSDKTVGEDSPDSYILLVDGDDDGDVPDDPDGMGSPGKDFGLIYTVGDFPTFGYINWDSQDVDFDGITQEFAFFPLDPDNESKCQFSHGSANGSRFYEAWIDLEIFDIQQPNDINVYLKVVSDEEVKGMLYNKTLTPNPYDPSHWEQAWLGSNIDDNSFNFTIPYRNVDDSDIMITANPEPDEWPDTTWKNITEHSVKPNFPENEVILIYPEGRDFVKADDDDIINVFVNVSDPDNDLVTVWLDMAPAFFDLPNNPIIEMKDDGKGVDDTANDGQFSLKMKIPEGVSSGQHMLNIFAADKFLNLNEISLEMKIEVKNEPPSLNTTADDYLAIYTTLSEDQGSVYFTLPDYVFNDTDGEETLAYLMLYENGTTVDEYESENLTIKLDYQGYVNVTTKPNAYNKIGERIIFRATDNLQETVETNVKFTILPVNDPPTLDKIENKTVFENSNVSLMVKGWDHNDENEKLEYSTNITDSIPGLNTTDLIMEKIDDNHVYFNFTLPRNLLGTFFIEYSVKDQDANAFGANKIEVTSSFTLTVNNLNDKPYLKEISSKTQSKISNPPNPTQYIDPIDRFGKVNADIIMDVYEDEWIDVTIKGWDEDFIYAQYGEELKYKILANPDATRISLISENNEATLHYQTTGDFNGQEAVTINMTDSAGAGRNFKIIINVLPTNDNPDISKWTIAPLKEIEGDQNPEIPGYQNLSRNFIVYDGRDLVDLNWTDIDGDKVECRWKFNCWEFADVDELWDDSDFEGLINVTWTYDIEASYNVTLLVKDVNESAVKSTNTTIKVLAPSGNDIEKEEKKEKGNQTDSEMRDIIIYSIAGVGGICVIIVILIVIVSLRKSKDDDEEEEEKKPEGEEDLYANTGGEDTQDTQAHETNYEEEDIENMFLGGSTGEGTEGEQENTGPQFSDLGVNLEGEEEANMDQSGMEGGYQDQYSGQGQGDQYAYDTQQGQAYDAGYGQDQANFQQSPQQGFDPGYGAPQDSYGTPAFQGGYPPNTGGGFGQPQQPPQQNYDMGYSAPPADQGGYPQGMQGGFNQQPQGPPQQGFNAGYGAPPGGAAGGYFGAPPQGLKTCNNCGSQVEQSWFLCPNCKGQL